MRISDWSSDVCSSDLDFLAFTISDLGNAALGQGYIPSYLGQAAVEEWRAIHKKGLNKTPDEIEAYLRKWNALSPEQIGRASCRERVGQYVEVSVVAVSLKKKTYNNLKNKVVE